MSKLAILSLAGTLETGFQVLFRIRPEGKPSSAEISSTLPAASELKQALEDWKAAYQVLSGRGIKNVAVELKGSVASKKATCQERAAKLEAVLNAWLQSNSEIEKAWLREIGHEEWVRVIIQSNDLRVFSLPWHLWSFWKVNINLEIGFSRLSYASRKREAEDDSSKPMKILAILGDSEGIDVDYDRQQLSQIPNAEVTFLVEPKREEITTQLWDQAWDILFFAGHSRTQAERGMLYLNSEDCFSLEELREGLKQSIDRGLQLAIFNSCDCLGLAWELEQLQIPQVIVMREDVPDRVAQKFLQDFLKAFSSGHSLYFAVRQARGKLEGMQAEFPCATWLPAIWQNPAISPLTWRSTPVRETQWNWKQFGKIAATSLAIAVGIMGVRVSGLLLPAELWAFDRLVRLRPDEPPDPNLLIVGMTAKDSERYRHPLPGKVFTQLLRKLNQAQPSVIGLDIFRDQPQEPGHAEFLNYLRQSQNTIALCKHAQESENEIAPPEQVPAERVGFSDVVLDPDNILRRHLLSMSPYTPNARCQAQGALSVEVAMRYLDRSGVRSQPSSEGLIQLGSLKLYPTNLSVLGYQNEGYQILLNYRSSLRSIENIADQVSVSDVLEGRVKPEQIRGRAVLIGVVDVGVKDSFYTPYGNEIRGLTIHAQMVSQLINAALGRRPLLWTFGWIETFGWILGGALIGAVLGWKVRSRSVLVICVMGAIVILIGGSFMILLLQGWVPLIPAGIGLIFSSMVSRVLPEQVEKVRLQ